jgi:CDGSH-type Zn-finger protein
MAQKSPFPVEAKSGMSYFWCACGRSATQPFCDGSHKGTGLTPVRFVADADETLYFCGCKATANPPFCDRTHNRI